MRKMPTIFENWVSEKSEPKKIHALNEKKKN